MRDDITNSEKLESGKLESGKRKVGARSARPTTTVVGAHPRVHPTLKVGDSVRISEGGAVAEILEIKNQKAVVSSGLIKMTLPLEQLHHVPKGQIPKQDTFRKSGYGNILSDINIRKAKFSPNLDLRGMNAEDATNATIKFLDDAVLYSEKYLEILHGRGDGVLRRIVRDVLKYNKDVQSFDYQPMERGGDGVTIVVMR
jgi:DNA mismatch repair protein MutS2